jgi:cytochrome c oxidase assembly factor CtaG
VSVPAIPDLLVSHWQLSASLDAEAAAVAAAYLIGTTRVRGTWPIRRTASFLAGIGCVLTALQSGIGTYDDQLLTVHMVQHLLLLLPAPLLLLLGRPVVLLLRVLRGGARAKLGRALVRTRRLAHPLVCLAVFYAVVVGTHIPSFFDAAVEHPAVHELMHALYIAGGLVFLWPLVGESVTARRLGGVGSLAYVIAGMPSCALVGGYLNRLPTVEYHPYAAAAHALGVNAVDNQQYAGALMWVGAHVFMASLALAAMLGGLLAEERRQQARDAVLAAGAVGVSAGPRRPGEGGAVLP